MAPSHDPQKMVQNFFTTYQMFSVGCNTRSTIEISIVVGLNLSKQGEIGSIEGYFVIACEKKLVEI
jgi:hypothetical protein